MLWVFNIFEVSAFLHAGSVETHRVDLWLVSVTYYSAAVWHCWGITNSIAEVSVVVIE